MGEYLKIHKAGGVLVRNRRALVVRSAKDHEHFLTPGGKIELAETIIEALHRELNEELGINFDDQDAAPIGTFSGILDTRPGEIKMEVFLIKNWVGEPVASHEIAELKWVNSVDVNQIKTGTIFKEQILPWLKKQNLID